MYLFINNDHRITFPRNNDLFNCLGTLAFTQIKKIHYFIRGLKNGVLHFMIFLTRPKEQQLR
jgi:hypothetical protein